MDDELVTRDHHLTSQGISAIPKIFGSPYYSDAAGNYYGYRPVVLASFAIEHALLGEDPQIGHGINVLLYALTIGLVFFTLKRLTRARNWWLPALAALIFALHPLHTEVVMSLKNRDELLGMLFLLFSLWSGLKMVDGRAFRWIFGVGLGYALAIMAIPTIAPYGIFIPLALVMFRSLDAWELAFVSIVVAGLTAFYLPARGLALPVLLVYAGAPFVLQMALGKWKTAQAGGKAAGTRKLELGLAGLALVMTAIMGLTNYGRVEMDRAANVEAISQPITLRKIPGRRISKSENPLIEQGGISERLGTSFSVMGLYLRLHILPFPLRYYYGYDQVEVVPFANLWALLSLLVHLGLLVVVILFWKKYPLLALFVAWYLAGILAASNLPLLIVGIVGERLVYPASLGFAVAAAWLMVRLLKPDMSAPGITLKRMSPAWLGSLVVLMLGYGSIVLLRAPDWESRYSLFRADMPVLENSAKAHHLLGTESVIQAMERQDMELVNAAHLHFMRALEIDPEFPLGWYDLGRLRLMMGNEKGAEEALLHSAVVDTFSAETYLELGNMYEGRGNVKAATKEYEKALAIDKGNLSLYATLTSLYASQEDWKAAVAVNELALEYFPMAFDPLANLGKVWLAQGDTTQALQRFEEAWAVDPQENGLRETLKSLYLAVGDSVRAAGL